MSLPTWRVVMVHPHDLWYDPWTIRILELARHLQTRGHQVTLFHMPRKDVPAHGPIREPHPGDPPIIAFRPRQQHVFGNIKQLADAARNADLIHVQKCFPASALPVLWVARHLRKPLHYDWDDHETAISQQVEARVLNRWHLAAYERMMPRFAHTMTVASRALRQKAQESGFPADRIWHVPVGADLNRFEPGYGDRTRLRGFSLDPDKLTVLYVGQMEGAAHAGLLIEAAPWVLEQYTNVQFLLVGGGEQLETFRRQAAQSTARHAIAMPGYLPAHEIPALVGAADICVASFHEDEVTRCKSPLKIAEYLAAGKPIVASAVGDVGWMIEHCGMPARPGSALSLAEGILRYVNDPALREQHAVAARHRAETLFNWDQGAKQLIEAYRFSLSGRRHA